MKVIGLLPVRNEAWVLPHTLKCLTGFCDVVLVHDQSSEDESRDICRQFSGVEVIESRDVRICEQARFRLLDAARNFDGDNLLWFNDADELVSPVLATEFFSHLAGPPRPGTTVECLFYNLWKSPDRYRNDGSPYSPHFKAMAFVDDRKSDYDRADEFPLHAPRVPLTVPVATERTLDVAVLHLQWIVWDRNQMKQAWYRCREWLHGRKSSAEINALYAITFDAPRARTSPVPSEWLQGVTLPSPSVDAEPSWHEREIRDWFGRFGVERFEPLEIWHIDALRNEFLRKTGRSPHPDRTYRPSWTARARLFAGRALRAARRKAAF